MRRPEIAQTSWAFCKDSMLMVLNFKFKCQLIYGVSVLPLCYRLSNILTFFWIWCAASAAQTARYSVVSSWNISRFRIIYLQPDSSISDKEIAENDKRMAVGSISQLISGGKKVSRSLEMLSFAVHAKSILKKDFLNHFYICIYPGENSACGSLNAAYLFRH